MTHFVGLDVSQKMTAICVVDNAGHRLWRGQCPTVLEQITVLVHRHAGDEARIGIETGAMTPWLVHELRNPGSKSFVSMPGMRAPPRRGFANRPPWHRDLARSQQGPEQHRGSFRGRQHGLERFPTNPARKIFRSPDRGTTAREGQAVEAEVAAWLRTHTDKLTNDGRRRPVRDGHLPEREILTGIGAVAVRSDFRRHYVCDHGHGPRPARVRGIARLSGTRRRARRY